MTTGDTWLKRMIKIFRKKNFAPSMDASIKAFQKASLGRFTPDNLPPTKNNYKKKRKH